MATYVVKARKTALKANFSASATQLTLNELLDSRGDPIVMASFGDWFALVIKQGSQVEIVKCDGLTQNGNGSATCDVATNGRNIAPIPPYTGSASGFTFLSGAEVIVTNDPLTMMYYLFNNENTWLQKQTFSVAPESSVNAVTANALVRKSQLDSAVLGVITSVSVVVQGIAGVTVADGDLIYFDTTADAWLKCDADTASTVNNVLLGIAQGSATIGNLIANGVMLRGTDDAQSGMSAGDIMYASNTAGDISNVAGTVPVAVGIASSATELYFEPRFNTGLSQNQVNALNGANNPSGSNVFITNNDTSATPSAGIIPRADANGTLNSFVTALNTTIQASEAITAKQAVAISGTYQPLGAITLDSKTYGGTTTTSVTVGNNSNRILLVAVAVYGSTGSFGVTSVTYGGQAMTQVGNSTVTNNSYGQGGTIAIYKLIAPPTGANNLVVSHTGTFAGVEAFSYYNVDQTTGVDNLATTTTNAQTTLVSGSVTLNEVMFGAHCVFFGQSVSGSQSITFSGNSTLNSNINGALWAFDSLPYPSAQSVTGTYSYSSGGGSSNFAQLPIQCAIIPANPVGAGVMKTDATNAIKTNQFIGFAVDTVAQHAQCKVQLVGVVTGLTGLVTGTTYYLSNTAGALSTTAGTNSKKVGIALSTTTLLIKHDN